MILCSIRIRLIAPYIIFNVIKDTGLFGNVLKMCVEQFKEKTNEKFEYVNETLKNLKNTHYNDLPMERKLLACFGLLKAMDIQIFNVNCEQNVEIQQQRCLALKNDIWMTSPGLVIRVMEK